MKFIRIVCLLLLNVPLFGQVTEGKLIFEDDFDRYESDDSKEELGNGWVTNSKTRAQGVKQADLKDNQLHITMAKEANHGVSVRHDAPFKNGIVEARFMISDNKGVGFNFNDPAIKKIAWAGHVCQVKISPKIIKINDQREGIFKLSTRNKRKAGATWEELDKLTKGTVKIIQRKTTFGKWYTIKMKFENETLTVWIDGEKVGSHTSAGFGNNPKQNLALAVSGYAAVDDIKIYSLD